jgi:hypothetical protein
MNQRIRELGIEAGLIVEEWDGFNRRQLDPAEQKFAQLIIKECIEKITTYDLVPGHSAKWEDIYDIHARLLQDLGEDLKQHFGVAE